MLGIASEDVIPSIFHNHKTISRGDDMMLVKCLWRVANDSVRSSETLKRTGTSSSEKSELYLTAFYIYIHIYKDWTHPHLPTHTRMSTFGYTEANWILRPR